MKALASSSRSGARLSGRARRARRVPARPGRRAPACGRRDLHLVARARAGGPPLTAGMPFRVADAGDALTRTKDRRGRASQLYGPDGKAAAADLPSPRSLRRCRQLDACWSWRTAWLRATRVTARSPRPPPAYALDARTAAELASSSRNIFFFRQSSPDTALIGKKMFPESARIGTNEVSVPSNHSVPRQVGDISLSQQGGIRGALPEKEKCPRSALGGLGEKGECPQRWISAPTSTTCSGGRW